jgi:transposase InsO family protein
MPLEQRYRFIQQHRAEASTVGYRMAEFCRVLDVSASAYYAWVRRVPSRRRQQDEELLGVIRQIHQQSRQNYGSPRVHNELRDRQRRHSRKRIERLMRQAQIRGTMPPQRRVVTTDSRHTLRVADNHLDQDFSAAGANQKWTSDITYIPTSEGWLYLATVLDLFSRRIVGWAMSQRIDQALTLSALQMALQQRTPARGLLHHSDRGSQYCALQYQQMLADWGALPSMSRRGNCYDNAVHESFHRTLKVECVWRQQYRTRAEAAGSIFEYIEVFYNRQRRHSSLGYQTPEQVEQRQHLCA